LSSPIGPISSYETAYIIDVTVIDKEKGMQKGDKKSDWLFPLVNKMRVGHLRELGRIEIVCR
jgi:hypothetical protein